MEHDSIQSISLDRIRALLDLAEKTAEKNPSRSKQYVSLAKKIGSRNKVAIPPEQKTRFCRKCNAYWTERRNVERLEQPPFRVFKCLDCGSVRRVPLAPRSRK